VGFTIPSVSDFKSQFARDFPYAVPAWGATAGAVTVVAGVITAIAAGLPGQGYQSASATEIIVTDSAGSGAVVTAVIQNGKITGFTVGAGGAGYVSPVITIQGGAGDESDISKVTNGDITGALFDAGYNVNEDLFGTQPEFGRAFLYLAAHMLCEKMLAAVQGLGSQYNWLTQSKSVGNVMQSFQIPKKILEDPLLAQFSTTRYGAMYLQIISPFLIGNMSASFRQSLP